VIMSTSASETCRPYSTCSHTLRATGIATYLQNGGTLEHAQQIAAQSVTPDYEAL
jgi:hypothetical protein